MKNFIKKTTFFNLTVIGVGLLLVFLPHYSLKSFANFKIPVNKTKIIVGHSHPECAFDDSEIQGFKNLAHSGESAFYTYSKVRMLIEQNPQIDTIFIEFSNNMISSRMDQWIWGSNQMKMFLPTYAPFMDKNELLLLYSKNPEEFTNTLSLSTRRNLYRCITLNMTYIDDIGGFIPLKREETVQLIKEYHSKEKPHLNLESISDKNLEYLKKTVDYCLFKKVKVLFVRSPQHQLFELRRNEKNFLEHKKNLFQNIEFLDFNDFPLKDTEFGDFGHLNNKGSKKFSLWFQKLLEDGLLDKVDKEEFVKSQMPGILK